MAKNLALASLLDFYGGVLTDKQRDMMEQYYDEDLSLAEIADNFGITRQGVRDAIKRGEDTLRDMEEKLGCAARYRVTQAGLTKLEELARAVRYYNEKGYPVSREIEAAVQKMLVVLDGMDKT